MDSDEECDMLDANDDDDDFYSGGDDDAAAAMDSDDAGVADYEFIDNDSDDSNDVASHRYQVAFLFNYHNFISSLLVSSKWFWLIDFLSYFSSGF